MTTVNIIAWVVIGGIAGLLFSALIRRPGSGGSLLFDLVVGLIGGLIGGVVLNAIGGLIGAELAGVNLGGAVVAIVGAVILIGIVEWLRSSQT